MELINLTTRSQQSGQIHTYVHKNEMMRREYKLKYRQRRMKGLIFYLIKDNDLKEIEVREGALFSMNVGTYVDLSQKCTIYFGFIILPLNWWEWGEW